MSKQRKDHASNRVKHNSPSVGNESTLLLVSPVPTKKSRHGAATTLDGEPPTPLAQANKLSAPVNKVHKKSISFLGLQKMIAALEKGQRSVVIDGKRVHLKRSVTIDGKETDSQIFYLCDKAPFGVMHKDGGAVIPYGVRGDKVLFEEIDEVLPTIPNHILGKPPLIRDIVQDHLLNNCKFYFNVAQFMKGRGKDYIDRVVEKLATDNLLPSTPTAPPQTPVAERLSSAAAEPVQETPAKIEGVMTLILMKGENASESEKNVYHALANPNNPKHNDLLKTMRLLRKQNINNDDEVAKMLVTFHGSG